MTKKGNKLHATVTLGAAAIVML